MHPRAQIPLAVFVVCVLSLGMAAADPAPGELPALGLVRVTQDEIENGEIGMRELRLAGLRLFATSFNKLDGYGDGPMDPVDPLAPGGRPSLQGNGTFLRVNGLDAQSCLECHSLVSAATVPPLLGVGGAGGSNSNAMIMPTEIDPADQDSPDGAATFNGRFSNPPFVFGAGGVELLALEMTEDLQRLRRQALDAPGTTVRLVSHGVDFGTLRADFDGNLDVSGVEGVDPDLVVRPFGRKGDVATAREFAVGAMQFHFGMQPIEEVGPASDPDGDGVADELLIGELSAISAFMTTLEPPTPRRLTAPARRGSRLFREIGCADCHVPVIETRTASLPLRYPEVATDPRANVFARIDLTQAPTRFAPSRTGGIRVPLFADLKRHDMGPDLAEGFAGADEQTNREFTTARLWGIADSAPYLHDGRATTLGEAIAYHGGEAESARDAFLGLDDGAARELLAFLRSLRTPRDPAQDLLRALSGDPGSAHGQARDRYGSSERR